MGFNNLFQRVWLLDVYPIIPVLIFPGLGRLFFWYERH